jgi:glycosyltransferase involved in cell wall biosynthesis
MSNVLIISPDAKTAHPVSKHNFAVTLSELGHRVFFLDPPDKSLRRWVFTADGSDPRLTIVRGPRVAIGLRFALPCVRRWLEARWLARFEKEAGCTVDAVWLFENSRFYDLRFAGTRLKIYHQVDLNQNFHPATAARTADICFCTTELIRQTLLPHNERVYKIHHGLVQVQEPISLGPTRQAHFERPGPHAVYVGNLDMQFLDVDLLTTLVARYPSVHFHFIGGFSCDSGLWRNAHSFPNITWWGKVESQLIPAILERSDILLVTYLAQRWRDQASPHKFMEYLASGKVVVSTYTDEYKDKRDLIEMADISGDFIACFDRVVSNLTRFNSPEAARSRRQFAFDHTYRKQLARVNTYLQQHGLPTFYSRFSS